MGSIFTSPQIQIGLTNFVVLQIIFIDKVKFSTLTYILASNLMQQSHALSKAFKIQNFWSFKEIFIAVLTEIVVQQTLNLFSFIQSM